MVWDFACTCGSSQVAEAVAQLQQTAENAWIVSEAATGVIRCAIHGAAIAEKIAAIAQPWNASIVPTQGHWPTPRVIGDVERRLMSALDPDGIFG